LGLSCAIASGKPFLRYEIPAPAGVLFVNAELPAPDLQERLRLYAKAGLRPEAPLRFLSTDLAKRDLPSLATPEGQAVIEERLDPSTKLLVLDAVSTLCPADGLSDDTATWNALQTWLLKLRRRGFSVLLVHHDDPDERRRDTAPDMDVLDQVFLLKLPNAPQTSEETRFEVHLGRGRQVWGDLAEPNEARLSELVGGAVWTRRPIWAAEPRKAWVWMISRMGRAALFSYGSRARSSALSGADTARRAGHPPWVGDPIAAELAGCVSGRRRSVVPSALDLRSQRGDRGSEGQRRGPRELRRPSDHETETRDERKDREKRDPAAGSSHGPPSKVDRRTFNQRGSRRPSFRLGGSF